MSNLAATKVRDIASPDPVTIGPEAPLAAALAAMRERDVRHLPVVDDAGRLVGILTDRDLRRAAYARARALREARRDLLVQDVMSCAVVTTHPEASIAEAAGELYERRVGSLPVVDRGRLVGILTERDLLRAIARLLPSPISTRTPSSGRGEP